MKRILKLIIFLLATVVGFFLVKLIIGEKAGKLSEKIDFLWERILFALEEGIRESKIKESEFKRRIASYRS